MNCIETGRGNFKGSKVYRLGGTGFCSQILCVSGVVRRGWSFPKTD